MKETTHHIVVFGATSFVGQILCRYLLKRHGANGEFKWAMAGRSREKLEEVRVSLGADAAAIPLIVCDASDDAGLRAMCKSTRVVVSTVGPYALYGTSLVKACVELGTDYCDLTGEVQWIHKMIKTYETAAKKSGARIVHCCGFDSIPSDLGVYFLQRHSQKVHGRPCVNVRLGIRKLKGGFSGGTIASLMNAVREATSSRVTRKVMANPYALCPDEGARGVRQPNVTFTDYNADAKSWLAPFIMAAINTRVVHRSNALSDNAYGIGFTYDEAVMTGSGLAGQARAVSMATGMAGMMTAVALPPTRWAMEKFVVPKPGEGPTPAEQEAGHYDYRFFGSTSKGQRVHVQVTGDRDPGYGSTAKMLGEAAACLALDVSKTDKAGGFWTPATIFGNVLIKRLTEHAGLTFKILEG